DGWAVGYTRPGPLSAASSTLIEHWNGRRWSRVPSPDLTREQVPSSVSAISAGTAWAVGAYATRNGDAVRILIVRWNGTRWSRVPSPNPGGSTNNGLNVLSGVAVASPRDAWAVGYFERGNGDDPRAMILHWNGRRWSRVPSPNVTGQQVLLSVSAASARDAWAVGVYLTRNSEAVRTRVAGPSLGQHEHSLFGVSTLSRQSAWVVGETCIRSCNDRAVTQPLVVRWNGRRWQAGLS
ncbi:MAG: hypothetical protein ACRDPO_09140, partial [Streptosporangiaceae bacterium]